VRNTRGALEEIGYRFPEREWHAPIVEIPAEIAAFYARVDAYLRDAYGSVERALRPGRRTSLAFAKSTYEQRLASSLAAARCSLARRLERVEAIARTGVVRPGPIGYDDDEDEDDDDATDGLDRSVASWSAGRSERQREAIRYACHHEATYLEELLASLDTLTEALPDPKIAAVEDVVRAHLDRDRVLVFSRYTDTIDAVVEAFGEWRPDEAPGSALYTGSDCWVEIDGRREGSTKDGVIAALRAGRVAVVFCSDAASEGLNLQAARVLVNIDVPWNPARLEQRIGRIARIGQMAPAVEIHNLWYPDSVEARMYTRLLARRDLYQVAVGEFPEIMSSAIKQELAARYETGLPSVADDPFAVLQGLRRQDQRRALARVWGRPVDEDPAADRLRRDLIDLVIGRARASGVVTTTDADGTTIGFSEESRRLAVGPGDADVITLRSSVFEALLGEPPSDADHAAWATVGVVDADQRPVAFFVERQGRRWLLPTERFGDLLAAAAGSRPLDVADAASMVALDEDDPGPAVRSSTRWLPDHRALRVPLDDGSLPGGAAGPDEAPVWTIRTVGRVPVA
jgi:hypothetical protein